ncbi:hypothetical protein LLE87_29240, partial [Paenibacillus polymyxa]|nr:hypothetical protein [Paenibacillus polymyxa]
VWSELQDKEWVAYPDTLVGTDSHTTMINGLGVLGWGVGGIEAEAAMLGQPVSMLIPDVVGFKLTGKLSEIEFRAEAIPALHPGQSAAIYLDGKRVGFIGVVPPELERKL